MAMAMAMANNQQSKRRVSMIDLLRSGMSIAIMTICLSAIIDKTGGNLPAVGFGISVGWALVEAYFVIFKRDKPLSE